MLIVVGLLLLGSGVTARAQVVDAEDAFVARVAEERSARGLGALAFAADLQVVARRHAQRMADQGKPYHNPELASEVQGWEIVAENVGAGMDVESIHEAFMASDTHRDVILHPQLTELGVGVVQTSDDRLWVVEVFRKPQQASTTTTTTPTTTTTAPPRAPDDSGGTSAVAPAPTVASTPPSSAVSTAERASPLPSVQVDSEALSADGVPPRGGRRAAAARVAVDRAVVIDPDVADVARRVPPAASAAAFLLAGVVGLQGQTLRRLGLVG